MMLKKIKILLTLLSVFCFAGDSYCFDDLKSKQLPFASRVSAYVWKKRGKYKIPKYEELKYTLLWNDMPAGKAVLELKGFVNVNNRKARRARLQYATESFLSSLFVANGEIESLFDDESKSSLEFSSKLVQNGKEKYEHTIVFNPASQTYEFKEDGLVKKGRTSKDVQDILTALCYIRTLPLKIGNKYTLNIQYEDKQHLLTIKALNKEKIRTNIGEFDCFVMEPLAVGEPSEIFLSNKMKIYITDDKKRMPALVKLESQIGLINAALESAETK
jgi:hypothetical protein